MCGINISQKLSQVEPSLMEKVNRRLASFAAVVAKLRRGSPAALIVFFIKKTRRASEVAFGAQVVQNEIMRNHTISIEPPVETSLHSE